LSRGNFKIFSTVAIENTWDELPRYFPTCCFWTQRRILHPPKCRCTQLPIGHPWAKRRILRTAVRILFPCFPSSRIQMRRLLCY